MGYVIANMRKSDMCVPVAHHQWVSWSPLCEERAHCGLSIPIVHSLGHAVPVVFFATEFEAGNLGPWHP